MENVTDKKALMVIAFNDFRDVEYFIPKEALETLGIKIETASNKIGQAKGADGVEINVSLLVSEAKAKDFDAVIFVGGPGCLRDLDNEDSYRLIRETVSQDKILGSICISPVILAKAGVLKGKKATVWSSAEDKSAIDVFREQGVVYQPLSVVIDDKIITASGPKEVYKFGEALAEAFMRS